MTGASCERLIKSCRPVRGHATSTYPPTPIMNTDTLRANGLHLSAANEAHPIGVAEADLPQPLKSSVGRYSALLAAQTRQLSIGAGFSNCTTVRRRDSLRQGTREGSNANDVRGGQCRCRAECSWPRRQRDSGRADYRAGGNHRRFVAASDSISRAPHPARLRQMLSRTGSRPLPLPPFSPALVVTEPLSRGCGNVTLPSRANF